MFNKLIPYLLLISCLFIQGMDPILFPKADISIALSGKCRLESFWGRNISLLNNCNFWDRIWWARHTFDPKVVMKYGENTYGQKVVEFGLGVRNKARWADNTGIATTTQSETRALDEIGRSHNHAFPRMISWVREIWLEFDIAKAVGLTFPTNPLFKIGAFPFSLGRGIALGSAYAVGPEFLGFYSDTAIDQFAFGAKISDTFIKDMLNFDFYVGLLQSRAGSLSQTGGIVLAQEYGRRDCPERGPYKINFVTASRLLWTVFNSPDYGSLILEPYGLYNHDPEQRVEFNADAESKLATLGFAAEYANKTFEFGFDYAVNLGRQYVKGWDRNVNQLENRNGVPTVVASHVYANIDPLNTAQTAVNDISKFKAVNAKNTIDGALLVKTYGKSVQNLIDSASQAEQFNGTQLGTVAGYSDAVYAPIPVDSAMMADASNKDSIFNASNRFRDAYYNKYEGWMITGDAAWWVIEKELRLAVTAGISSGDTNPNELEKDGVYSGFIPLQEVYSGKRVQSVFLLGSGGQLSRPLSQPRGNPAGRFASSVNGFSNLILTGGGLLWKPASTGDRKVSFNPNVIAFWQHYPGFKFNAATGKDTSELASPYLGLEVNLFFEYMMFKNTKFFMVSSMFIPGKHFSDIKGRPINATQEARLNRFNRTSITGTPIPNIGDDYALSFNIGMEVSF